MLKDHEIVSFGVSQTMYASVLRNAHLDAYDPGYDLGIIVFDQSESCDLWL